VFDEDGEPVGYRPLTGIALLSPQRREAFEKLPSEFSFKEAKAALNRGDASTDNFLQASIQGGVLKKFRKGRYGKVTPIGGNAAQETGAVE
jgi:hypothetical protein